LSQGWSPFTQICLSIAAFREENRLWKASGALASFHSEVQMKQVLIASAIVSALAFSPVSAQMMPCTADNLAKSMTMMPPMQTPANQEMAMANTDMSNGKMKSACMHYMKAQKMSMMKNDSMGMMK
jgi:hypothetical protein